MSAPLGARRATRRYVGLTALRWLPVGLSAPVTVLLASARGLSPADIGIVFAVYSAVVLVLELPTGGLADAVGHRPVLVLAGILSVAGLLATVAADGVAAFALAQALMGVGRALDSGALEAWYVDTVRATDPDADVTPGLSRAGAADGAGLCLGALLGGLLPLLAGDGGTGVLAAPLLLAAALSLVSVLAIAVLVVPVGRRRASALRASLHGVPGVVRGTVRLAARDRVLRRLLAISLLVGAVLATLELLGPLHVADLTGSRTEGAAVFGVVMAVSFAAAGVGALLAPAVRRLARGSVAAATTGLAALGALAVAAVTVAGPLALGCLFAAFYVLNAAAWPLWKQLLHGQVAAGHRATTLSASSLALQVGALTGSLLLPRLAESAGLPAGFWAAAGALLLVALVSLGLRPGRTGPRPSGTAAATRVAADHG
ncbi:MFS transporter [Geodermatophilus sp. DSM 45219]|uniref:MFS transporter n=1 Tax=Geodermatophilus sp. DSM 45219 TaxID=1881103 RepID=UPI00087EED4F|nr:MFS transporter [Geodermatophilus sp. DSM 45219]SDO71489.1 Predicted arabinose efflux permease, MFS family [Geodermatophilus sp. DSM 45219]